MSDLNSESTSKSLGQKLESVLDFLMKLTENFDALALAVMSCIIFWQVIARIIKVPTVWTEEVSLVLLVWFGLTGAAIGVRKGSHISIEFIASLFPKCVQKPLNIFNGLLMVIFSLFLIVEGYNLTQGAINTFLPATNFSRGWLVYTAIPTAGFIMMIYSLEIVIKEFIAGGKNNG